MKSYDLAGLKALLPEYLHAIGTEVFLKGESQLTAACPIHGGAKRNFHAKEKPDGTWVWICRSGCGGDGGTVLDLHALLHGLQVKSANCISGAAGVLKILPSDESPSKSNAAPHRKQRRQEEQQRAIAKTRQRDLTTKLAAKRTELLAPYCSDDWRADYFHDSPLQLKPSHDAQARQMIEWLFDPDDLLWMGDIRDSNRPVHRSNFRPAKEWLHVSQLHPRLSAGTYREGSFSRSQANLVTSPYLIIESDDLIGHKPTTAQEREENQKLNAALMRFLVDHFHLELRALIDTGGKSLHGWFSHPSQETTRALSKLLDGLAIDKSVFNQSSSLPLRAPGCLHETTGRRASLYYLNPTF
ncbi:MAG: hypothetical protein QNL68_01430 [Akkermansiaceae bacterium]|jgi:hypothetical protein